MIYRGFGVCSEYGVGSRNVFLRICVRYPHIEIKAFVLCVIEISIVFVHIWKC